MHSTRARASRNKTSESWISLCRRRAQALMRRLPSRVARRHPRGSEAHPARVGCCPRSLSCAPPASTAPDHAATRSRPNKPQRHQHSLRRHHSRPSLRSHTRATPLQPPRRRRLHFRLTLCSIKYHSCHNNKRLGDEGARCVKLRCLAAEPSERGERAVGLQSIPTSA